MEILGIHSIITIGKAGLNVVVPILSHFSHTVLPLPTCSLSSLPVGYGDYKKTDLTQQMRGAAKHFKRIGKKFDFIYSGYLANAEQAEVVLDIVSDNPQAKYLCDPVLGDNGKLYSSFDEDMITAMKQLAKNADIITPNFTESQLLGNLDDLCKCWAITSYPKKDNENLDILCSLEGVHNLIEGEYMPSNIHGTGDAFASFVIAYGLEGNSFYESSKLAMNAVKTIIGGEGSLQLEENLNKV